MKIIFNHNFSYNQEACCVPDLTFIDISAVLPIFVQREAPVAFAHETTVSILANSVRTHIRKHNAFVASV